ncbi:CapA family protein, partial [Streptomyces albidoflavus]
MACTSRRKRYCRRNRESEGRGRLGNCQHAHPRIRLYRRRACGVCKDIHASCISAGADAVLCHGHHGVRGVELQDGKPIFHGLGPFVFQPYLFPRQPSDFYEAYDMPDASLEATYAARREAAGFFNHREHWEAMLIQLQFRHGREPDFQIYPISLWPPG